MKSDVHDAGAGRVSAPRLSDTFTIYDLYQAALPGLDNEYVDAARLFVTSQTAEAGGVGGQDLWGVILENLVEQLFAEKREGRGPRDGLRPASLYDTHFLAERGGGRVIGTISVLKDDGGRGRRYGLEGVWLGGFNVLPEYRGRGLGGNLFYYALERVQVLAGGMSLPVRVNLFTASPTVRRMAEGFKFRRGDGLDLAAEGAGTAHYLREYGAGRPAQ